MDQSLEQLERSTQAYANEWAERQVTRAVASAQRTVGAESFVANLKLGFGFRKAVYKTVLPTFREEAAIRREIAVATGEAHLAQVTSSVEARIAALRKMAAA